MRESDPIHVWTMVPYHVKTGAYLGDQWGGADLEMAGKVVHQVGSSKVLFSFDKSVQK
jgi:hypothetical protein